MSYIISQLFIEMLITHGSLLEAVDKKKRTALFRGAAFGQERCVQALLDQNVSVTKRDIYGKTAFHIAAQCGHVEVLKRLLGVLENSESVHDLVDKDGFTALHCAALGGHESCVDLLISMVREGVPLLPLRWYSIILYYSIPYSI